MPPVTRSKKSAVADMDELSGLMSGMSVTPKSTPRYKTPRVKKEKDISEKKEKDISDLFSRLALGSKTKRRRKGVRFTHKKTHKTHNKTPKTTAGPMTFGGSKRRRRRTMRRY